MMKCKSQRPQRVENAKITKLGTSIPFNRQAILQILCDLSVWILLKCKTQRAQRIENAELKELNEFQNAKLKDHKERFRLQTLLKNLCDLDVWISLKCKTQRAQRIENAKPKELKAFKMQRAQRI